jgi:hypothetical protein
MTFSGTQRSTQMPFAFESTQTFSPGGQSGGGGGALHARSGHTFPRMHRGSQTPLGSGTSQQTSTPGRQPCVAPHFVDGGGGASDRPSADSLDEGDGSDAELQAVREKTAIERSGSHVFMG